MKNIIQSFVLGAFLCAVSSVGFSAATILGTPVAVNDGSNYTAETGSSRVVVITLSREVTATSTNPSLSTLAWGTATLANGKITQGAMAQQTTTSISRSQAGVYYIKEVDIPAGANAITATWAAAMNGDTNHFFCYTIGNVLQSGPVDTTATNVQTGSVAVGGSITVAAGSVQITSAMNTANNSTTLVSPHTTQQNVNDGTATARVISGSNSGSSGSINWGYSLAQAGDGAIVSFAQSVAPTFSVAPAIGTRTTSTIPVTATTACTDCNYYGVSVTAGSGAPTCSQVKAGQNSGGTSAYKAFGPVAMTTTVQNTGTFSTYTDGTVRDGYFCLNSTANGDSAVSSIANMYKIPAFTSGPTFASCGTGGCTYSYTLDGAGTVYGVACKAGSTAATVAQTEAAQCTGGAAAQASANKAVTGADTLVVGTSLTLPEYDFALVGTYGSQHEAAIHADNTRLLTAPATCGGNGTTQCQYITIASIGTGSPCASFNSATSPAIAASDILKAPTTTHAGAFSLTIGTDCQFSYPGDTSRQDALNISVYDYSVQAFHADNISFWANDQPPVCPEDQFFGALKINVDSFSYDFGAACANPEGDTLTCAKTSGTYSPGLTLTGCVLSGTPTTANLSGDTSVTTVTDLAGATATQSLTVYPANTIPAPDCTTSHLDLGSCIAALNSALLNVGTATFTSSKTVSPGAVISQSPAASVGVDTPWTVNLTISTGNSSANRPMGINMGLGIH